MLKYNLAVVGAGLGGLAAAALAARHGKKTIIFEQGHSAGGILQTVNKDGFAFNPGPHLSFGFEREGTFHNLGENLGIALNASLHSPSYQVALPDRRITIYAEHSEMLEEFNREFPKEIDRIAKFYRDLRNEDIRSVKSSIAGYLLRRRKAGSFIKRYAFSTEFIAFLDVQSVYFFRRRSEEISLLSLIRLCDTSPYAVEDGFNKIAEQLVEVVLKNDGELYYGVPFSEIIITKERNSRITTSQGMMEADAVLLNTEQQTQGALFFFGIRNDVIPVAMLQNVICLPDYARIEDIFSIALNGKGDEHASPDGLSSIIASFPLWPAFEKSDNHIRHISMIMPFLNDFTMMSERYRRPSRSVAVPEGIKFKPIGLHEHHAVLNRASAGNTYLLNDGLGTPAGEIAAVQAFAQRLRF